MFWTPEMAPNSVNLIWSGGAWCEAIMASAAVGVAAVLLGLAFNARQRRAPRPRTTIRWPESVNKPRRATA